MAGILRFYEFCAPMCLPSVSRCRMFLMRVRLTFWQPGLPGFSYGFDCGFLVGDERHETEAP